MARGQRKKAPLDTSSSESSSWPNIGCCLLFERFGCAFLTGVATSADHNVENEADVFSLQDPILSCSEPFITRGHFLHPEFLASSSLFPSRQDEAF
jgi:hypothetical protein